MKRFICVFVASFTCLLSFAQNEINWSVFHDKRKLFHSSIENEEQNNIALRLSELKSDKNFIITYTGTGSNTTDKKGEWVRTIGIYTSADKELFRKDSSTVKIPDLKLKYMLQESKMLKVYTWSLPKDPKEAARVRIRRVHLCTIILTK
jgi:hypothetical protein